MMKKSNIRPRAALLIGAALLATPAFAQDAPAPQSVTPPPILVTPAPAPAPATPPRVEMAPSTPIVQPAPPPGPAPATAQAPRAETRAATRPAPARQTTRTTTTTRQAAPAPATAAAPAAPVAQPAPAPVAEAPAPTAVTPAPEAAAPAVADTTTTQTETVSGPGLAWPWLLGGLLLVVAGAAALLLRRRRRDEPEYVETVNEAPVAPRAYEAPVAAAPLAAAPIVEPRRERQSPFFGATAAAAPPAAIPPAADELGEAHVEAEITEAESEDLAGITDAPAPVAHRPWLELGLRPIRAGTSDEEALVDVELTVGNSGDVPARDVRISTFMLADSESGEMESILTEHRGETAVPPVTIEPGDGTRVDAHLAVPKGEMGRVFNPVVIAEARYTLPDGSEGRTSAKFKIGRPSRTSKGVGPIGASRPHMVEGLTAELLGTPEHA